MEIQEFWIMLGDAMNARAEAIFQGKVQGVWFRANTKEFADKLGITGTVRNLPDGTVEAVFEGDRNSIESVIFKCQNRQPMAKVTGSRIVWKDFSGEFKDFSILR
jgi:acylphosphatase